MRTIGLIGGMSWESSAEYYRIINRRAQDRLGAPASARCILWSFDFAEIAALQVAGDWPALTDRMVAAARALERAGAEILVIASNTMHRMADQVAEAVSAELIHIVDPTAKRIKAAGIQRVGLLGTAFTMEQDFYRGRLADRHGLEVLVPDAEDRATVHRIIYDELVAGVVDPRSSTAYRAIIARLAERGAQAVILGCTEIMLLISAEDSPVPLFDTTRLHAEAALDRALA